MDPAPVVRPTILPVSIVIPTRNRAHLLRAAVESILAGAALPRQLIIADQSDAAPAAMPTSELVELIHLDLSSTGPSRARNAGSEVATGKLLAFVDDDMKVDRDWLELLVAPLLATPERVVTTGAVLAPPELAVEAGNIPSLTDATEPTAYVGRQPRDVLWSGSMALERTTLEALGGFDEQLGPGTRFGGAEDNDFGFRILEAGYRIEFVRAAVAYHYGTRSGGSLVRLTWAYASGQGAFYAKHARATEGHMVDRFRADAGFRARRLLHRTRIDRRTVRDLVHLAGLIHGAVGWLLLRGYRRLRTDVARRPDE